MTLFAGHCMALVKAPPHLEPSGLYCSGDKCPEGTTLLLWKCDRSLIWMPLPCPDASLPLRVTARGAGDVPDRLKSPSPYLLQSKF